MNLKVGIALASVIGALGWVQDEKCDWKSMRALNGPEDGVYFRGEASLSGGTAVVSLPAGFGSFVKPASSTIQITCVDGFSPLSVSRVSNGQFTVSTTNQGNRSQAFFWEVKATSATSPAAGN